MSDTTPVPAPTTTPASRLTGRLFRVRSVVAVSLASAIVGASGGAGAVLLTSDASPAAPDESQGDFPGYDGVREGSGGDGPEVRRFLRMPPEGPGGLPPRLQPDKYSGDDGGAAPDVDTASSEA